MIFTYPKFHMPAETREDNADQCVEVAQGTPANCFAHCIEDGTPSDLSKPEVRSIRDTYDCRYNCIEPTAAHPISNETEQKS